MDKLFEFLKLIALKKFTGNLQINFLNGNPISIGKNETIKL